MNTPADNHGEHKATPAPPVAGPDRRVGPSTTPVAAGLRISALAVAINTLLAAGKIVAGVFGNSYALIADGIESSADIEKYRIRKSGLHLSMDIHVAVDGELSVNRAHAIAHQVKDRLLESQHRINDVTVHIEPLRKARL